MPRSLRRVWAPLLAGVAGLVWFLIQFHLSALDVTNLGWVMHGDWGANELGWLMFRRAPWTFPIGSIPGLLHPVGTSIAVTDSTPLVSLVLKPLSPLLPEAFQFVGPWLALCFTLQGVCGAVLTGVFTEDERLKALGGTLFALAPVLYQRTGHASLCGQWLVLLALWLALAPLGEKPRRRIAAALGLVAISALVHPYLWVMVAALVLAFLVRVGLERRERPAGLLVAGAMVVVGSAIEFFSLGIFGHGLDRGVPGFGVYNTDLVALFNPNTSSRLLPALPHGGAAFEGFGYLGAGVIALLLIAAVLGWRNRSAFTRAERVRWLPVWMVCGLMALYSLGPVVTFAGHPVATLHHFYRPLGFLTDPLRSSGRFIWPLAYLVGAASLAVVLGSLRGRSRTALVLLAALVTIQWVDLRGGNVNTAPSKLWNRLRSPKWDALAAGRRHVVLYPAQVVFQCPNEDDHPKELYVSAVWLAYRHSMTVNSGYVARVNRTRLVDSCEKLIAQPTPRLDSDSLYLVADRWKERFEGRSDVRCESIDGQLACVSAGASKQFPGASAAMPAATTANAASAQTPTR